MFDPMQTPTSSYSEVCLRRSHLLRTITISVVVGTWLTLFNQGDVVLAGTVNGALAVKVALNYFTPFVVSNLGLVSRRSSNG